MNNTEHIRYKKNNTSTTFLTIFDNPRIQLSLEQLSHNSSTIHTTSRSSIKDKNCQHLSKIDKENSISRQRQTFRSFARMRRSYKTSGDRKNYIDLKQQMERLAKFLQNNCIQIELSRFLQLKQKIMLGFLNELINDLSQQNLDKAELLVVIWNNLFLLAQKSMEKICQFSKNKEKVGLEEQVDTHNKYQKILESYLKQREQMKKQKVQKQHFMRILVAKIRQYKKTMKKMEQTLRIAAEKLNQFRRDYLQVQIQCINLTMELKNVGQKTAKEMVCKKMALIMQKSKQYKFLPSKKKMRKERKQNRIKTDEKQNVAIKEQFYEAFLSSMSQKPEDFVKHVWRAIETIIDKEEHENINYSIFNENLIQSYQEEKVDQSTDMAGFFIEKEDKKVGIDPKQRFCFEMTKMKGVQTIAIQKPPQIKMEEIGLQCNFNNIRISKFNIKRSFDLSFLFENTLKKTSLKNQEIGLIFASNANLKKKPKVQREQVQQNLDQQIKQESFKLQLPEPILELEVEKLQETNFNDPNQEIDKNDPYRLDIRKKIKKIPSTFHNKITMLSGFLNFHKSAPSKSEHESKIEGENDKAKIQDTNLTVISQRNNEENQKADKSSKKIKFEQKDQQTLIFSKSNKRIQASQSFKSSNEKNSGADKKSEQRKVYKNSKSVKSSPPRRSTPAKQGRQKSVKMERNQKDTQVSIGGENIIPRNQEKERSAKFTNVIKKQFDVDVKQFYHELEQELEKNKGKFVESTNKHSSRLKGFSKIIDSIFQGAAKDYEANNRLSKRFIIYAYQSIFNLYGIGNTNYIQKRVISFIQEIYQFRETSTILSLFLMMLGLTQNGQENEVYSQKNNQIVIKLTRAICSNLKYPFKFSELSLNLANIQQNIQHQLKQSGFCDQFIFNLSSHIRESSILSSKHVQPSHVLFSILKHITQRQNIISISYEPILNIICSSSNQLIPTQFIPFLVQLHYFPTRQAHRMLNQYEIYLARNNIDDGIDRALWAYFCSQNQILDFSRLFHRTLNIFKLKQCCALLQNIELERITKSSLRSLPQKIVSILVQNCLKMNDKNAFFHAVMRKNVLAILYLKMKDEAAHKIVNDILGNELLVFNEIASNQEQCWS